MVTAPANTSPALAGDNFDWTFDWDSPLEPLPNSFIWAIWGGRGQGKSALAVKLAYHAWFDERRPVLYWPRQMEINFHQTIAPQFRAEFPPVEPITLLDLARLDARLNNAFVIMDEMHMIMPSTRASAMALSQIAGFLTQIRKRGSNLVWCTNQSSMVHHSALDQTDIHGACIGGKYLKYGNMVIYRYKDTQGRYSKGVNGWIGRRDVRRRGAKKFHNIKRVMRLYNTNAIADPAEIWALDKSSILGSRETDILRGELGIGHDEALAMMKKAVIYAVEQYEATTLSGAGCAAIISEQFMGGAKFPPSYAGKLMAEAGLPMKRGNSNNFRVLPPRDLLEDWAAERYVPPEPGTLEYAETFEAPTG